MAMATEFYPVDSAEPLAPIEWRERVQSIVNDAPHPGALLRAGITAELLVEQFGWSTEDLLLLGLKLADFADVAHYPLIVLYDRCAFRATHLFAFELGYADLESLVLRGEPRYAQLLRLNLPYWRAVLGG